MKTLLEIENNYNKSELEMFRVFYEEYGEEKLLLGATKRLHDGYEAYRNIRDGEVGPITKELSRLYFQIVRGDNSKYIDFCTPVSPNGK